MAEIIKYIGVSSGDLLAISITNGDIYLNADCDIEDIINLIGDQVIASHAKILVLYPDETINYEIPQEDLKSGGSYSENYQNGQRRSLSFSLYNEDGKYTPNINTLWAGTRLRLDLGLERNDGSIIWFKKGVFVISSSSVDETSSGKFVNIQAGDKFSIFENKTGTLEDTYEIPVGSDIQSVIQDILWKNQGDGHCFDIKPIIYHSSFYGKKTQATISKTAGDSLGSLLLELATQLSAEIFYNSEGNLTLVPSIETTLDVDKPLIYEFTTDKGDLGGLDLSFDMNSIINRIIVMGTSGNNGFHKAVAINDDPGSPLCYQKIGYRTGGVINDSNITSDYLAEERAKYELRKQLIIKSSTSVNIIFNPLLTVNNLIAINDDFFNFNHEKFLLQGISCSLDYSGQMSMTISNIANFAFLSGGRAIAGSYAEVLSE